MKRAYTWYEGECVEYECDGCEGGGDDTVYDRTLLSRLDQVGELLPHVFRCP